MSTRSGSKSETPAWAVDLKTDIADVKKDLTSLINTELAKSVKSINNSICALSGKVEDLEVKQSNQEAAISVLSHENKLLSDIITQLEIRSMRCNIIISGLPEQVHESEAQLRACVSSLLLHELEIQRLRNHGLSPTTPNPQAT